MIIPGSCFPENGGDLHAYFQAYQLLHTMVNQKDNEDGNSSLRTDLEKVLEGSVHNTKTDLVYCLWDCGQCYFVKEKHDTSFAFDSHI